MNTYFALLNENSVVVNVLVVPVEATLDEDGNVDEQVGSEYCQQFYSGNWVRSEIDGSIRKNHAGIGHTYDSVRDAFIPPKPIPEAILDEETCRWLVTDEMLLAYSDRTVTDTLPEYPEH